ncbi:MAG TPA: hypothetical protein VMD91_16400 [Candidatus Sulfotelmatobacter sp.]|nr:hypothetical protein [Candidatus Sulfotelmatobacter sp.]
MNVRQLVLVGLAALALGAGAAVQVGQAAAQSAPPTPPPPNNQATPGVLLGTPVPAYSAPPVALPSPSPSAAPERGRGRRGRPAASPEASPSETPEPPQFSTLDGVWEMAIQPLNGARTTYSHLYITQKGDQLSGTWVRGEKKGKETSTFTGSFDGRLFKLSGTDAHATFTLSGYVENFSDMVGLLTAVPPGSTATPAPGVPFTAGHRKASRDKGVI